MNIRTEIGSESDSEFRVDAHYINALSIDNFTFSLPLDYPAYSALYSSGGCIEYSDPYHVYLQ